MLKMPGKRKKTILANGDLMGFNGDESHGPIRKKSPTKTHPSMSHYLQRFHYISSDFKNFLKHVSLPTWRMGPQWVPS